MRIRAAAILSVVAALVWNGGALGFTVQAYLNAAVSSARCLDWGGTLTTRDGQPVCMKEGREWPRS